REQPKSYAKVPGVGVRPCHDLVELDRSRPVREHFERTAFPERTDGGRDDETGEMIEDRSPHAGLLGCRKRITARHLAKSPATNGLRTDRGPGPAHGFCGRPRCAAASRSRNRGGRIAGGL